MTEAKLSAADLTLRDLSALAKRFIGTMIACAIPFCAFLPRVARNNLFRQRPPRGGRDIYLGDVDYRGHLPTLDSVEPQWFLPDFAFFLTVLVLFPAAAAFDKYQDILREKQTALVLPG